MFIRTNPLDFEMTFYERIVAEKPDYVDALMLLAEMYTAKGLYEKGLAIDRKLVVLRPEDPFVHYNLACSLALIGKKENAWDELVCSIRLGYADFEHMKYDSDLKCLHTDPKWQGVLAGTIPSRPASGMEMG